MVVARIIPLVIVALAVGIAAAFVAPARPSQTPSKHPHAAATIPSFVLDAALDNPYIEEDNNINPSRKCSVCIGVSFSAFAIMIWSTLAFSHLSLSTHISPVSQI